jgi:asparagine synthase (glutamine-hydrolysing)
MGGIAGIWQIDGQPVDRTTAERFISALAHRGPDGQGVVMENEGRLALAHRRLAPLDQSRTDAQPMSSASGHCVRTLGARLPATLQWNVELRDLGSAAT